MPRREPAFEAARSVEGWEKDASGRERISKGITLSRDGSKED